MKHSDHIQQAGAVSQGDPHRPATLCRLLSRGHLGVSQLQSRQMTLAR
jgi:hypothetical protein